MALTGKLPGETQLASLIGEKKTILTDKRVVQEDSIEARIIPLANIDSFGLVAKQKKWFLIIGSIISLYAIYELISSYDKKSAIFMLLIGCGLIAVWWFTRKMGGVIYSLSGEMEIFFVGPPEDIVDFLNQVQMVILNKK